MDTFSGRNHKSSDNVWTCLHQTGSDRQFRTKRAIYVACVTCAVGILKDSHVISRRFLFHKRM